MKAAAEIKRLVDIFRGRIIDVDGGTYTIEITGTGDKLDAFLKEIGSDLIVEVVRSGVLGIVRGGDSLSM
jgi:acetolactate synthase-1/3 small subunit